MMELNCKDTNVFCHQLVEIDGQKFILDASSMKPKSYYWGIQTTEISVEMMELKDETINLETLVNQLSAMTIAIIVQPVVGLLYFILKNIFQETGISQQILLKLILFVGTMLISYIIFCCRLSQARKKVCTTIGIPNKRYMLVFKPKETRRQIFDAYLFNIIILVCLAFYLFNNDGSEGIFLIIAGIITMFLLVLEFGKVPILSAYKIGNVTLEDIREIN